jgi:hypothetical protein
MFKKVRVFQFALLFNIYIFYFSVLSDWKVQVSFHSGSVISPKNCLSLNSDFDIWKPVEAKVSAHRGIHMLHHNQCNNLYATSLKPKEAWALLLLICVPHYVFHSILYSVPGKNILEFHWICKEWCCVFYVKIVYASVEWNILAISVCRKIFLLKK